jgi:hypothetical protein
VAVDVIVQQSNCLTVSPFGLSKQIRDKMGVCVYSERKQVGRKNLAIKSARYTPGTSMLIQSRNGIYVANLFAQYAQGKPGKYNVDICEEDAIKDTKENRIVWFSSALNELQDQMRLLGLKRVAFPLNIGCGLADDGDWNIYSSIIEAWAISSGFDAWYQSL